MKKLQKTKSIKILKEIISLIEKRDYKEIEKYLEFSPAGDGWGEDNYFINFGSKKNPEDINDIFCKKSEW